MRIRSIEPIAVSLPMLKPLIMAGETVARADNVLARIEGDDGLIGWGEAACPDHDRRDHRQHGGSRKLSGAGADRPRAR